MLEYPPLRTLVWAYSNIIAIKGEYATYIGKFEKFAVFRNY